MEILLDEAFFGIDVVSSNAVVTDIQTCQRPVILDGIRDSKQACTVL